jgi:hypothetical protein
MAKPLWAIENLLISTRPQIYCRTEDPVYRAENLALNRLYPSYKTSDYAIKFNGTDNYATVPHHSEFNAIAALTIEAIFKTPNDLSGSLTILSKAGSSSGYSLSIENSHIVFAPGSGTTDKATSEISLIAEEIYRLKVVFYHGEIKFYLNGLEIGFTIAGTIPANLVVNSQDIYVGADTTGQNLFKGSLVYIGLNRAGHFHGGYLDIDNCVARWNFLNNLKDSSNSFDLNWHGATPIYQVNNTFQILGAIFNQAVDVDFLFLDRRHNLSSAAVVKLYSGLWSWSRQLLTQKQAEAGKPLTIHLPEQVNGAYFHLEIDDQAKNSEHISIPYLFLGKAETMKRGFLRGYSTSKYVWGESINDGSGGNYALQRSEPLQHLDLEFRLISHDKEIFERACKQWQQSIPVVFAGDSNELESCCLVKKDNPLETSFQHRVKGVFTTRLRLMEVGN